jgi:hypothetical protein
MPASASRPIFTATPSISSSTALTFERRRLRGRLAVGAGSFLAGISTTAGTKAVAAGSDVGSASRPRSADANPAATRKPAKDRAHAGAPRH